MAKIFSFTVPNNDNMMVEFDNAIKPVDRSTAIRTILRYVMSNDKNFLRSLLGLPLENQDNMPFQPPETTMQNQNL